MKMINESKKMILVEAVDVSTNVGGENVNYLTLIDEHNKEYIRSDMIGMNDIPRWIATSYAVLCVAITLACQAILNIILKLL